VQGPLWSRRASDWFEIQETQSRALYDVILKAIGLNRDSTLLDAGCGSGMFCSLVAQKGASVMGLDASSGLLDFARRRAPHVNFFEGEMEELPFVGLTFDTVTMLNSLQHTTTPLRALSEARRVLRPGGRLAIASWARPEQCQIADFFRAVDTLLPVESSNTPAAFSFSDKGILHNIVARAGFTKLLEAEALTIWTYPDEDTAVRGLLSTSAAVKASDFAGEERVIETTRRFLAPYRLPRGGFRLENAFRYLIAQRS
jgi:SAM-dependent methyltransferase